MLRYRSPCPRYCRRTGKAQCPQVNHETRTSPFRHDPFHSVRNRTLATRGVRMNLTMILGAKKDKHARKLGDLILGKKVVRIGDAREVFEFVSDLDGRFFRIIYRCLDGSIRDMTGRQGVHNSKQDGEVLNMGHAMRNVERLNLSFWTDCQGGKVNLGTGHGYRTIKAEGILLLRIEGTDILTDAGIKALASN